MKKKRNIALVLAFLLAGAIWLFAADNDVAMSQVDGTDNKDVTLAAVANGLIGFDGSSNLVVKSAAALTPWVVDIDADGFDLADLSNLEFRTTTGAPAGTVQALWADAGGINLNVPSADVFDFLVNNVSQVTIGLGVIDLSSGTFDFTLNAAVDALNFDSNTLTIDATGNRVGIGTAAPIADLEIEGVAVANGILHIDADTSGATVNTFVINSDEGGSFEIGDFAGTGFVPLLRGESNAVNGFAFTLSGEIPPANDVLAATGAVILFDARQNDATAVTAANTFLFRNFTTVQMLITQDGKVGINTTDPSSTLDVNGAISGTDDATTLGAAVTTFAVTTNFATITGDGGGNTIATITGGTVGQQLILLFVDAFVTITDDNTHAADSIDLNAAFTSADDTVLPLIYNGTSWYESAARSVN